MSIRSLVRPFESFAELEHVISSTDSCLRKIKTGEHLEYHDPATLEQSYQHPGTKYYFVQDEQARPGYARLLKGLGALLDDENDNPLGEYWHLDYIRLALTPDEYTGLLDVDATLSERFELGLAVAQRLAHDEGARLIRTAASSLGKYLSSARDFSRQLLDDASLLLDFQLGSDVPIAKRRFWEVSHPSTEFYDLTRLAEEPILVGK